ncbi:hypothetical protein [Plebeiibacterium sediminum]|uniref:Uncharacterized protein n=1 Tax=Plebeiibacterium sediminum TaxID=2992112 RepID=A0AAE3M861_9BACT|nr:hypothetical protein [Plebeiobacterium sediminum]MCW3788712.1 hypothetical protein [Plebeiobacterium sediminum]
MIEYSETIKYRNLLILDIIFFSPLLIMLIVGIGTYGTKDFVGIFGFLTISIIALIPWLKFKKGFQRIKIDGTSLIHEKYILWKWKSSKYSLKDINNIRCSKNEDSKVSYSFVIFEVGGVKKIPESTKNYIKNPTALHFDYNETHVKIGELLQKFEGDKIVKIVIKNKRKLERN